MTFADSVASAAPFPPPLDSYPLLLGASLFDVLATRVQLAPFNPSGRSLLAEYFAGDVLPIELAGGAVLPTAIAAACFMML